MELAALLFATLVLTTAEFCPAPIEGGIDDPQFCRFGAVHIVSTPYFSISVEPNYLVGVHKDGKRLLIQSTLWQSQDHLLVEVHDGSDLPDWGDCAKIEKWVEDGVSWQDCRVSMKSSHERRLTASHKGRYVLIQYGYSSLGTTSGPALERMTQSVHIHAI